MPDKRTPRRRLAKKKPSERAILGVVRVVQVLDEESGQLIRMKGIFPAYALDRKAINDRGLRDHDLVMLDVFKDRNPRFWKKFHALSMFIADQVPEMEGLKAHTALKRLQLAARVHCELQDFVLEDGTVLQHWVPKSLSFDDTDETIAGEVWEALCDYVARHYFASWTADQVKDAASFWERDQT